MKYLFDTTVATNLMMCHVRTLRSNLIKRTF